jgi:hypothetical protein
MKMNNEIKRQVECRNFHNWRIAISKIKIAGDNVADGIVSHSVRNASLGRSKVSNSVLHSIRNASKDNVKRITNDN